MNIGNKRKAPNADNVYSRLGKNYDKVDDEIVFFFFFREKMNDEIVVQLRQKTFLPRLYTIAYSMHLMKVKLDHLLGGKCTSKRSQCEDKILCIAKVFCFVSMYIYFLVK